MDKAIKCKIDDIIPRELYNVSDLCNFVGISRTYYYKLLKNESIPSVLVAYKIVCFFKQKDNFSYCIEDFWR